DADDRRREPERRREWEQERGLARGDDPRADGVGRAPLYDALLGDAARTLGNSGERHPGEDHGEPARHADHGEPRRHPGGTRDHDRALAARAEALTEERPGDGARAP